MLAPWKKSYDKPRQHIKKQRHHFANKSPSNQSYGFSSSYVWMRELNHKEGWALKNWCFQTVVMEKTLESPLDCKDFNSKGNQSWIFIGRTDAEAETPVLWPPDVKNWLITLMLGKIEGRRRKRWQNEMVEWHHWLNGHEFEEIPGTGNGQGSLVFFSPWGPKELDMTKWLNWLTEYKPLYKKWINDKAGELLIL